MSAARLCAMLDEHAGAFNEMIAEYRACNDLGLYTGFYDTAWQGYEVYRATLQRLRAGGWPFPEVVPSESYFVMDGDSILGEVYLRFGLTAALEKDGGNVGYQVRPSARNRGIATQALRLALIRLAELGLQRALATCSELNEASVRVIERNGGVAADDVVLDDGIRNRRYWFHLGSKER